jgi:hypothetical protein
MTLKWDKLRGWLTMLDGGLVFDQGGFGVTLYAADEPP